MTLPNCATETADEKQQHVLWVTLNRPESRNALDLELATDLRRVFAEVVPANPHLRCVVLTGAGAAFCAGADLKERLDQTAPEWLEEHRVLEHAAELLM